MVSCCVAFHFLLLGHFTSCFLAVHTGSESPSIVFHSFLCLQLFQPITFLAGGGFSRFTCTLLINGVCIQSWFSLLALSVHPVLRPCVIFVLSSCVVPCVFHLSLFTAVPSGVLRHLPVSPRVARFYFFT